MRWLLLGIMVFATVIGDLLQSHEMKLTGKQYVNARGLAKLLRAIVSRRYLALGIACMAVSFFAFMALLQSEALSFVVPASAATILIETLLAKFVLNERVGIYRTAGSLLVLVGVILLAR